MSKKSVGSLLLYFTPWRSISRAGQSLVTAKKNLADTYAGMRNSLPNRTDDESYPEDDPRKIEDDFERFEVLYELNRWNENELIEQIKACKRTKKMSLICAVMAIVAVIYTTLFVQLWMLIFLIPLEGCLIILGFSQAFKFALYQYQLTERSLVSAHEFFSRPDFVSKLIN